MSRLDNKEVMGIIYNNRDDPDKMGRCQVYFPHMGTKVNLPDLAWLSIASSGNNDGPLSFDRPPQEGTMCSVAFPQGSGSVNGIIKSIINGIHNPSALTGIDLTKVLPGIAEALNFKPNMNGAPDIKSVSESNETGAEKITTEIVDRAVTSMTERMGLPSNLVTKALVPLYDAVSEVSTALEDAASSMTSDIASMIPGDLLNMASVLSQNLDSVPAELQNAVTNLSAIIGSSSPLSGTNFAQVGKRINSELNSIASSLSGATNFAQLEDAVTKIKTNAEGILGSFDDVSLKIDGAFGPIDVSISASGGINISLDDAVQQLIQEFQSLISGMSSATGELLGNSDIMNSMNRLPVATQAQFKEALEKIPAELSLSFAKSNAFFGG